MQITPLPTEISTAITELIGPDGPIKFVVLICTTPAGPQHYFLDPDTADQVSANIAASARQGRTGIVPVTGPSQLIVPH